jgi:biopolymer transport protein ExbB
VSGGEWNEPRNRIMAFAAERRSPTPPFIVACLAALFLSWAVLPAVQTARAQDAAAPDAGAAAPAAPTTPVRDNMFIHMIKSIGVVMGLIFVVLSVSLVALVVLLAMDVRMGDSVPPAFVEEFTEIVNKRKFKEAYELAKNDNSFLARVLSAGMARLQYGIEDARDTATNTVESIKSGKEQLTTYLATIGSLGPLLGLVGTVYSMVGAFREMATDPNIKPAVMAGILSHGLVVTMVGIALAVPAIFAHAFFRNRITRISIETASVADDLLTQMYHNSKPRASTNADNRASSGAVKAAD